MLISYSTFLTTIISIIICNHIYITEQKIKGKPVIVRKSLSPPGKVTKTPCMLTDPWYTDTFIEQVNNSPPCINPPPKQIHPNISQIAYAQPSLVISSSSPQKAAINGGLQVTKYPQSYSKQKINHVPIDIASQVHRQNHFMTKDIEQNQYLTNISSVQATPKSSNLNNSESQKTFESPRFPARIIDNTIQHPSSSLERPPANPQNVSTTTATFPNLPYPILPPKTSNSSYSPPPVLVTQTINHAIQPIQVPTPIIKYCQSSSTIQSPIVSSTSIQELPKEDCLFCKYEKLGIWKQQGKQPGQNFQHSNQNHHDHIHHHSIYKINEPPMIPSQPSIVLMKDHPQYVSSTSRSLSPPNMSSQKLSQVVSNSKLIPTQFHKPLDQKEIRVSMNPVTINRSGSLGARITDTQPLPPPKIFITPSSPTNNQSIMSPKYSTSPSNNNTYNQSSQQLQYNSNIPTQIQQIKQTQQSNDIIRYKQNFEKSPKSIDSEKSMLSQQSPYFKDPSLSQSPPHYLIPNIDSFKSQNSDSILTNIYNQTSQISFNSPQPTNKVRSVKCSNNFTKPVNNLSKVNESFKDTSQSNSSLLIQQLNKLALNEGDYYNNKSNIISPAPIAIQQQDQKDPFQTANFQKTLIKSQHRPSSIMKNTVFEQNKTTYSQFSLGSQINFNNNVKDNSSSSTLSQQKSPLITAHFIDQQQKQFFPNFYDNTNMEDDGIKYVKQISPIQSSLTLNAGNSSMLQNQIGVNQEQLNFYHQQNKKIQDQINSQNAIRNMRQNEIDEAQMQLHQLKNIQKEYQPNKQIYYKKEAESMNLPQSIENDNSSSLEYSFNNSNNFKQDQQTMCIIDEVARRIPNKQNDIQQIKVNYPQTIDTIREEDLISRRGTINQIIDKANLITQIGINEGLNFSINDLSSYSTEKRGDGSFTPNSFTPEQRRFEQAMTPLSDQSYAYKKKQSDDSFDNIDSTIKKNPPNFYKDNLTNTNQRFPYAHEPQILENIETATKQHQYQIASPSSINSFTQQ